MDAQLLRKRVDEAEASLLTRWVSQDVLAYNFVNLCADRIESTSQWSPGSL